MSNSNDNGRLILELIIALAIVAATLYSMVRKRRAVVAQDGPILSSEDMLGAGGLQSMNKGTLAGFQYDLLTNDSGRVMFFVELGHNSWSHIIAYGDESDMSDITTSLISKKWLEMAKLEGDFPDYFHMFCNPEAQQTLREVFTPDIMINFENFCRSYDFEIFHDTLYLSQAQAATDSSDQTTLTTDVTNFLERTATTLKQL